MIFAQMLERVALSDLASVLCARKFSFAPQGGGPKIVPFSFLFIIIILLFIHYYFKALRLVAAIFMCFFLIWPPPRDLSIARLLTYKFQTPLWIFLIFGMNVVFMVFFVEVILYMAWKFLIWRNFGHLRLKFGHFLAKIDSFESFWPITSKRRYESS